MGVTKVSWQVPRRSVATLSMHVQLLCMARSFRRVIGDTSKAWTLDVTHTLQNCYPVVDWAQTLLCAEMCSVRSSVRRAHSIKGNHLHRRTLTLAQSLSGQTVAGFHRSALLAPFGTTQRAMLSEGNSSLHRVLPLN